MQEPNLTQLNFTLARKGISKALSFTNHRERRGHAKCHGRTPPDHVAQTSEFSLEDLIADGPTSKVKKSSYHDHFHKSMSDLIDSEEFHCCPPEFSADSPPEHHRKRLVYKKLLQHGSSGPSLRSSSSSSLGAGTDHSRKSGKSLMKGLIRQTSKTLMMVGESTSKMLADSTAPALQTSTDGKLRDSKTTNGHRDASKSTCSKHCALHTKEIVHSSEEKNPFVVLDNKGSSHRPALKRTCHEGGKADLMEKTCHRSLERGDKSKKSKPRKDDSHYTSWERKITKDKTGWKDLSPHKSDSAPARDNSLKAATHHPRLERNHKRSHQKAVMDQDRDHATPRHSWSPTRPRNASVARTRSNDPPALRRSTSDGTRTRCRKSTPSPKPPSRWQHLDHLDGISNHSKDPRSPRPRPTLSRTQSDAILLHRIPTDTKPRRPTRIQSLSPKRSSGRIYISSGSSAKGIVDEDTRNGKEQEDSPHPRSSVPHIRRSAVVPCRPATLRRVASDRPRRPKHIHSLSPMRSSGTKLTTSDPIRRDGVDKETVSHSWPSTASSTSRQRSQSKVSRSSKSPKRSSVNQCKCHCKGRAESSRDEATVPEHEDPHSSKSRTSQSEIQSEDLADKRAKLKRSQSIRLDKGRKLQRSESNRHVVADKRTNLQRAQSDRPHRPPQKLKGSSTSLSPKRSSEKQRRPDPHRHCSTGHIENETENTTSSRPSFSRTSSAKLAPSRLDLRRTRSARLYRQNLLDLYSSSTTDTSPSKSTSFGKDGHEQDATGNEPDLHQNSPTGSLRNSRSGRNQERCSGILRKSKSMRISRNQRIKCEHISKGTTEEQQSAQPKPSCRSQLELLWGGVAGSKKETNCEGGIEEAQEKEPNAHAQTVQPSPPEINSGGAGGYKKEAHHKCTSQETLEEVETDEVETSQQPSQDNDTKNEQPSVPTMKEAKEEQALEGEEHPQQPPRQLPQLETQVGGAVGCKKQAPHKCRRQETNEGEPSLQPIQDDPKEEQLYIPPMKETKEEEVVVEPLLKPPPKHPPQLEIQSDGTVACTKETHHKCKSKGTNKGEPSLQPSQGDTKEEQHCVPPTNETLEEEEDEPHSQPPCKGSTKPEPKSGGAVGSDKEEHHKCRGKETNEAERSPQLIDDATKQVQPCMPLTNDIREEEEPRSQPPAKQQSVGGVSSPDVDMLCNHKAVDSAPRETLDDYPVTPLMTPRAA